MKKILKFDKIIDALNADKKTALIFIVGFLIIFLIFISEASNDNTDKETKPNNEISLDTYCNEMEDKVQSIVSSIDGAGKTKVMITIDETKEYIYAKNESSQNKSSDNSHNKDVENDYVIIEQNNDDSGLLVKTIEPKIKGVAIVCEGGDDPSVQQEIYSTVSALFNISTTRISITKLSVREENNEE